MVCGQEDGNFCIPTVTLELLDNPSLIIPKHGDVVLLGGAEGLVVGGTGKYRHATGPYSTRLKVETIGGFFAYYDELFFRFRNIVIR